MYGITLKVAAGLSILSSFIALLILTFNVSGLKLSQSMDSYTIYASFENIAGLIERSRVTVAGVAVGRVTGITLDKDELSSIVEMSIDTQYDQFTTDTIAAILTAGFLGGKYIGLISGADDTYLEHGDMIEDTQSALVLEEMFGQVLFSAVNE